MEVDNNAVDAPETEFKAVPSMPLNLSLPQACLLLIFISVAIAFIAEFIKYKYIYSSEDYKVKYLKI